MEDKRLIMLKNDKDGDRYCNLLTEFKSAFKEEYEYITERYFENHQDEIELIATTRYCNKYGINCQDVDLYDEQNFLDILNNTAIEWFEKDFKYNWNMYTNSWEVMSISENN
jgi:hypothetical protein